MTIEDVIKELFTYTSNKSTYDLSNDTEFIRLIGLDATTYNIEKLVEYIQPLHIKD